MEALTWKQIKKGADVVVKYGDKYIATSVNDKYIGDHGIKSIKINKMIKKGIFYENHLSMHDYLLYSNNAETKTWLLLEGISIN